MGNPTSPSEVRDLLSVLRQFGVAQFEGCGFKVAFAPPEPVVAPDPPPKPADPDRDLFDHEGK